VDNSEDGEQLPNKPVCIEKKASVCNTQYMNSAYSKLKQNDLTVIIQEQRF
jgi:hypothetical protein